MNFKLRRSLSKPSRIINLHLFRNLFCLLLFLSILHHNSFVRAQVLDSNKQNKEALNKLLKEKQEKDKQQIAKAVKSLTPDTSSQQFKKIIENIVKRYFDEKKDGDPCHDKKCALVILVIIVISVMSLGVGIVLFLSISRGPKDKNSPLGLPEGSIRAIIAILIIVFYILVSVMLSIYNSTPSEIATYITKTLGTLVVAVSAFYFGSKTAEQSAKNASENFSRAVTDANSASSLNTAVPAAIIKAAIDTNKASWLTLYGAQDIIVGKKQAGTVTNDLECIVFIVTSKGINTADSKTIPPFIVYNFQGKTYNIPTDVQIPKAI
jgi:ABC-type multidrug transport system fused ATPase/permease subunit